SSSIVYSMYKDGTGALIQGSPGPRLRRLVEVLHEKDQAKRLILNHLGGDEFMPINVSTHNLPCNASISFFLTSALFTGRGVCMSHYRLE
ncbi:hypothetical protein, partial [Erythrobacter sp. YJ-T3-07]|uniref:hypothetical protein n=1 Tax=Erythrobacter sp. YJ-T3-07 TaxID=2793063 RepID=UPI001F1A7DF3